MRTKHRHDDIISAIRMRVPNRPGVYLFKDGAGKTAYIGKSVHLRQRMLSYFRAKDAGMENRIRQMVFNIADFDFFETETELLALLLEDQLIKRDLPWYNIRQKEYTQYKYLALTEDSFPTWKMMDHEADFARLVAFGPFRDRYFVDDVLSIIHRHFHMRVCQDAEPFRRSLNYEMGFCLSPCRGKISVEAYSRIVGEVIQFLQGDDTLIRGRLKTKIARFSETLEYEKAATVQRKLEFCRRFCARQRFIHQFTNKRLSITDNHGERSYAFDGDRVTLAGRRGTSREVLSTIHFTSDPRGRGDKRFELDRANIVYNWINKRQKTHQYRFHRTLSTPGLVRGD